MRKPTGQFLVTLRDGRHCETVLADKVEFASGLVAISCHRRNITAPPDNVTNIEVAREGDKEEEFSL